MRSLLVAVSVVLLAGCSGDPAPQTLSPAQVRAEADRYVQDTIAHLPATTWVVQAPGNDTACADLQPPDQVSVAVSYWLHDAGDADAVFAAVLGYWQGNDIAVADDSRSAEVRSIVGESTLDSFRTRVMQYPQGDLLITVTSACFLPQ